MVVQCSLWLRYAVCWSKSEGSGAANYNSSRILLAASGVRLVPFRPMGWVSCLLAGFGGLKSRIVVYVWTLYYYQSYFGVPLDSYSRVSPRYLRKPLGPLWPSVPSLDRSGSRMRMSDCKPCLVICHVPHNPSPTTRALCLNLDLAR